MPVVFREEGFRFFFYSKQGVPLEPPHIHVLNAGSEAKFWLRPSLRMAYNRGSDFRTLRDLIVIVQVHRKRSRRRGMDFLPRPMAVHFDDAAMWIDLEDGRILGVPLAWFPRLMDASSQALNAVELSPCGLHRDALDEDISIAGLFAGRSGEGRPGNVVAS